ncbi:MAG: gluconeogenesis factor YvcK family protein [Mycobacteriales bacterium]
MTDRLTAVVTVADDGGSSGRLRREFPIVPPGDLRMALAALAPEDEWAGVWQMVLQYRFPGDGAIGGHAVGNLLLAGLTGALGGDLVAALDLLGRLLHLPEETRVLPMTTQALEIVAEVSGLGPHLSTVRGQVAVATTRGRVHRVAVEPADPPACPQAVAAVQAADALVFGPGSLYTSVLPHLLVPELRSAVFASRAARLLVLNLTAQRGETDGFAAHSHLDAFAAQVPGLTLDLVLADRDAVLDFPALTAAADRLGARVVLGEVADPARPGVHDPDRLAESFLRVLV